MSEKSIHFPSLLVAKLVAKLRITGFCWILRRQRDTLDKSPANRRAEKNKRNDCLLHCTAFAPSLFPSVCFLYEYVCLTVLCPLTALPKQPTSLIVTETTATSVTLTWDSGNPEPVSYYIIQYRAKLSDNGFQEVDGVATTRYSIGGLSPFSEYEFRVIAVNNVGRGASSSIVDTRTSEQAPSSPPLHVEARMLGPSTMLVQWKPPEEPNGLIRGYRVYYTSESGDPLSAWQKHNTDDSQLTTISDLTTDITYSLRVLGFTSVGDGPPSELLQIKTQQGGEDLLTQSQSSSSKVLQPTEERRVLATRAVLVQYRY